MIIGKANINRLENYIMVHTIHTHVGCGFKGCDHTDKAKNMIMFCGIFMCPEHSVELFKDEVV